MSKTVIDFEFFLLDNKSGHKTKWSWVRKALPDFAYTVNEFAKANSMSELKLPNLIYNYFHGITEPHICPVCNENILKFKGMTNGYSLTCSLKCGQNHPDVQKKIKETYDSNRETHKILRGKDNPFTKG